MKKPGAGSFQLEPDGFSIHTLEIVKKLSNKEYKRIRDSIYQKCPKGEMYSDRGWQGEGERYRCKWFWREGLRINLEKNVHKQVSTCYLRIAVNPRKLIDPSSSYTRCVRCGRIIDTDHCWYPLDNDDPYCADCCSTIENSPIHDYYFKPYPIFYGDGPRYFGVELEIDDGGECDSSAEALMDVANQSKTLVYCKHDGSLDDGFEIVTHPMSLDCQLHEMPWAEVLDKAISMGYLSHQAGTCGLHVHVSRKAFGDTLDAQDNAIARVLFFVERHWAELLRFSRRTQRQLEQWAARYGYRDRPGEMLEHVKKGHGSRYTCVNLTNADTIEFRMFRGTLKLNTLIAILQLVDHICDAAIFMPDDELHDLSWSSFVSAIKEPELVQYLKERNLYVNEPVEGEGEV